MWPRLGLWQARTGWMEMAAAMFSNHFSEGVVPGECQESGGHEEERVSEEVPTSVDMSQQDG